MLPLLQLMRIHDAVATAVLGAPNPAQCYSNLCISISLANNFW